jgi:hypothetical protein
VAGDSVAYLSVEPSRQGAEHAHKGGAAVLETQSDVEVDGAAPWSAAKLPPTYVQPAGVASTITEVAELNAYSSEVDGVAAVNKRTMSRIKYCPLDAVNGVTSFAYIFTSLKCGYLVEQYRL